MRNFSLQVIVKSSPLAPATLDLNSPYDRLLFDAERSGLNLHSASIKADEDLVALEIENNAYEVSADAIQTALTLSEIHFGTGQKIRLHLRDNGYLGPTVEYTSPKTNRGQLPSPVENLNVEAFNAPELSFQEPQG